LFCTPTYPLAFIIGIENIFMVQVNRSSNLGGRWGGEEKKQKCHATGRDLKPPVSEERDEAEKILLMLSALSTYSWSFYRILFSLICLSFISILESWGTCLVMTGRVENWYSWALWVLYDLCLSGWMPGGLFEMKLSGDSASSLPSINLRYGFVSQFLSIFQSRSNDQSIEGRHHSVSIGRIPVSNQIFIQSIHCLHIPVLNLKSIHHSISSDSLLCHTLWQRHIPMLQTPPHQQLRGCAAVSLG